MNIFFKVLVTYNLARLSHTKKEITYLYRDKFKNFELLTFVHLKASSAQVENLKEKISKLKGILLG